MICGLQESALGYERNRWAAHLGPLLRLWGSLLPSLPNLAQLTQPPTAAHSQPLDLFLASEAAFAQQLVTAISSSLAGLSDLVTGAGVLTPQLQVWQHACIATMLSATMLSATMLTATVQQAQLVVVEAEGKQHSLVIFLLTTGPVSLQRHSTCTLATQQFE